LRMNGLVMPWMNEDGFELHMVAIHLKLYSLPLISAKLSEYQ
jgi:hypothetical protein